MSSPRSLPDALRPAWDGINALEKRIGKALESGETGQLEELAAQRHAHILEFFAAFPIEASTAPARMELLQELIARNSALMQDSRTRLDDSAGAEAQARHARRAIGAYRDHGR